jgi:mono/diheme cytochrome c family protein
MRGAVAAVVGLALTAAGLTGCGGAARPRTDSGRAVFAQACSACHSLSGREDPRRQGGDLLAFHSDRAALVELAREMPVRRPLSASQLRAVVDYVMTVERRGHE